MSQIMIRMCNYDSATRHLSREPSPPPAVPSSPSLVPGFGSSRPSAFSIPRRPAFTTEAPLLVMR